MLDLIDSVAIALGIGLWIGLMTFYGVLFPGHDLTHYATIVFFALTFVFITTKIAAQYLKYRL